ncbi:hypothetical protein [Phaeobacter sp. J2-8]|uniref:hypothetical protein n=1 Tax=Phaeobacter sp. J2-8 TaxID=2931394 RepID=UPI001FD42145|nr:hypothetical protein [Phaeobacter sp. J2-8]MCJ7872180.1 hypothetical protein [Phaeobacter sp. J2-8]
MFQKIAIPALTGLLITVAAAPVLAFTMPNLPNLTFPTDTVADDTECTAHCPTTSG